MEKIKDKEEKLEEKSYSDELDKSRKYMDRFQKAKTFNNSRFDAYAELMAFYQGNQHLLKKYKNDVPWVVNMNTPYAAVAIDNRVSSIIANDYVGELLPLSQEDITPVETLAEVYKKEWRRMKLDDKIKECIKGSSVVREFYCYISFKDKETIGGKNARTMGKMEAHVIEPARVFIDPTARSLRDARYMFVAGRISKDELKEKYPDYYELLQGSGDNLSPNERGEVYYDNDYTTEQDDVYTVLEYYGKEKGKIERVRLINGVIVLKKMMNIRHIPICQMRWEKAAQSCYGLSLMDKVLCLQKAICSIESAITNTAMAYAAPSMMVRRGCGVDPRAVAKANGAPGVVYAVEGDLDNALRPVIPPKIQQEILNIKADFQAQIDKITGNTNQFLGDIGTAGNTSSGAKMAVERAKIIEKNVLQNIEEFVKDITEVMIDYIIEAYSGEKMTYMNKSNSKEGYEVIEINMPDRETLKGAEYDYYIELEAKTPYSRERQKEMMLEIYQLERQYDTPIKTITVSDIIKNTDLENKDEIIKRFNQLNFQDAQTKADAVINIYTASQGKVNPELIASSIAEIIGNQKETPATDELMKALEQQMQQQMQETEAQINNVATMLTNTPQQQAQIQNTANNLEMGLTGQQM